MRRVGAVLLAAVVLAACGGSPDGTAGPSDGTNLVAADDGQPGTAAPDDDGGEADGDEADEPPRSSLGVTGGHVRSDVEIRIAEILTDLEASPAPQGAVVEIDDTVLFDFDSAQLRPEAASVLDDVVEVLELLADAPAQVRGHTDDVGADDYNLRLSRERAEAVADYLVSAGIDRRRLTTEGLGSTEPVADNEKPDGSDDPDGRARNRRVEIVFPTVDLDDLPQG